MIRLARITIYPASHEIGAHAARMILGRFKRRVEPTAGGR